jgi:5-methylcytosine-specific restriction protein A
MAPPRPCLDCARITTHGPRCPVCQRRHWSGQDARRGSRHERGYGNDWLRLSAAVLARDGYQCAYCGGLATTADHVVPRSRGGSDDPSNLVAACRRCNSRKGGR